MVGQLARAVSHILTVCPYVIAVHDFATKVRLELTDGYLLDLYFNPTLGKYTYALIYRDRKIYGWDNAPHHPGLATHPHHFHDEDGNIQPSTLTGDPERDIALVIARINARFKES